MTRFPPRWHTMGSGPRTAVFYREPDGAEQIVPLDQAGDVPFEPARPEDPALPRFSAHPRRLLVSPTGRLIGYESWLESKWTTLVDFDLDITAFVGQPLTFDGVDADGPWQHTDLFARRADGSVLLLDVKNPEKLATSTFGTSPPHLCSLRRVGLALQPGGPTGRPVVPTPRALERASGDVQCVYVVPDHRAAGLGGRLIDAVVNLAHELGLERLTVHSGARAISAYSRHGFAVSPRLLQAEFTQESR